MLNTYLSFFALSGSLISATLEISLNGSPIENAHPVAHDHHERLKRSLGSTNSDLPQPENVQVKDVNSNSIHLTWELPKDAEGRNLEVKVMIYPVDDSAQDPQTVGSLSERKFVGLDPGKLYTFIIATANEYEMCDPIVINQDTIPLEPEELLLKTFDYLDLELTFLGEIIPHRIDTSGIEAKWAPPNIGECDCYDAEIEPREGHMITPSDPEGKPERGSDVRQFIHLVPGKMYTVTIWSTTCGVGAKGPLRSEPVLRKVIVPPLPPGEIHTTSLQSSDRVEVCWPGPSIGHFNQFIIKWHSDEDMAKGRGSQETIMKVDGIQDWMRQPDEQYCHTITGLIPCEHYNFAVTTAHDDVNSLSDSLHRTWTLPGEPRDFHQTDYSTDYIDIQWQKAARPRKIEGYEITINPREYNITLGSDETSIHIGGLNPGTRQDIQLQSFCKMKFQGEEGNTIERKVYSQVEKISQATRPLPPLKCTLKCIPRDGTVQMEKRQVDGATGIQRSSLSGAWETVGLMGLGGLGDQEMQGFNLSSAGNFGEQPNDAYDIQLTQEIYLNVSWLIPQKGSWDGFVISYSPFVTADPVTGERNTPPFFVGAGTTMLEVFLPRTDQQYTVYIRTVSEGIESEPLSMNVVCGSPVSGHGNICQPRKDDPAVIQLDETEIELGLNHLVLADYVFDDPLTADDDGPQVSFKPGGGFQNGGNTMVIRNTDEYCVGNPCDTVKIHFQVCTHGFGCHPKLITAACPCDHKPMITDMDTWGHDPRVPNHGKGNQGPMIGGNPDPTHLQPNACCGNKGYHTGEKICCHDQLFDIDRNSEVLCCGTRKYEKNYEKCCIDNMYSDNEYGWSMVRPDDKCTGTFF